MRIARRLQRAAETVAAAFQRLEQRVDLQAFVVRVESDAQARAALGHGRWPDRRHQEAGVFQRGRIRAGDAIVAA